MHVIKDNTEDNIYSDFNYSYSKYFFEVCQLLDFPIKCGVQNQQASS